MDRLVYALIGALFGALLGLAGWWLYGLAHSLNYSGPGMDPVLMHWLKWSAAAVAVLGLVLKERIGDLVGDAISAVFHFESNQSFDGAVRTVTAFVYLAIVVAAIWHTSYGGIVR